MPVRCETVLIDPQNPQRESINRAAVVIRAGGLVAYPTETYYALGADALNEGALRKVYDVKGRSFLKALTVIIDRQESLFSVVQEVPPEAEKLMERFWPGPLTIIFAARSNVPNLLTAGAGKVGVRVPSALAARALASAAGSPLTATSANPSGEGGFTIAKEVSDALGEKIDLILDGGETPGGNASSILDVTFSPPLLIRAGAIPKEMLEGCLRLKISGP